MGPEHKNLAAQTDALNQLQAQIRAMDSASLFPSLVAEEPG